MAFSVLGITLDDLSLRYSVKAATYVYDDSIEVDWEKCEPEKPLIDNVIDLAKVKALLGDSNPDGKPGAQPDREDPER